MQKLHLKWFSVSGGQSLPSGNTASLQMEFLNWHLCLWFMAVKCTSRFNVLTEVTAGAMWRQKCSQLSLFVEPLIHLHHTAVDERQERGAMVVFLHAACLDVGSVALPGCAVSISSPCTALAAWNTLSNVRRHVCPAWRSWRCSGRRALALKLDRQGLRYLCKKQRTPRFITQIELKWTELSELNWILITLWLQKRWIAKYNTSTRPKTGYTNTKLITTVTVFKMISH